MNAEPGAFFSPDYAAARARFRAAAAAAGALLDILELDARGPRGETLTIDIAWIGARTATRVLLNTSGVHGVEAFAGSAIQLAALADPLAPPPDGALALAHALNPYGMAWLRRANENNVDLNRNFLKPGEGYRGAPELYARLDALLNPPSPPGFDWFHLRALASVARHGLPALKQAIAEGQYEYPRGLFYGGSRLEQGPQLFIEWLKHRLPQVRCLFAVDTHTGLGQWGGEIVIFVPAASTTPALRLERSLMRPLVDPTRGASAAYVIRGGLGPMLAHALPGTRTDCLVHELGTYSPLTVLRALREENRWHHHGAASLEHPAKQALREALCPQSEEWRRRALGRGLSLLRAAAAWTFRQKP